MENMLPMDAIASALPFNIASHATPNFFTPLPMDAPVWPTASRRLQLSPREWDELKPIIQQLYIDEGRTFNQVAVVLQTNYNFTPTKKQFDDKIKKWGLRKNATRSQRALILEELHNDDGENGLKETSLKLNPRKVDRWEREEKLSGLLRKPGMQNGKAEGVSTSKATVQKPSERALSPLREIFSNPVSSTDTLKQYKTIWDMINIPRSPTLTSLKLALKIDDEFPIPPPLRPPPRNKHFITQDQWSDLVKRPANDTEESKAETSKTVVLSSNRRQQLSVSESYIWKWLLSQVEKPWTPLNELYPFPISVTTRKARHGTQIIKASPGKILRLQIMDSEGRLRKMQNILPPGNLGLMAEIERLARLYHDVGKYRTAESLYHRLVLARQDALGPYERETLYSCLDIINMKLLQGAYSVAAALHRDLDPRIQELFDPWDDIALLSKILLTDILFNIAEDDEAEMLQRAVLQIVLNKYGQRHEKALVAMRKLANMMTIRKQFSQGEDLLYTSIQVGSLVTGNIDVNLYYSKLVLGDALAHQKRYAESHRILRNALRLSTSTFGMEHPRTLLGIFRLAVSLKGDWQLEEAEILLKGNLWRHKQILPTHHDICNHIACLADVMGMQGCWTEAADLSEHSLRYGSKIFGPDSNFTKETREQLEYSYAMQGLFREPSEFSDRLSTILESTADITKVVLNPKRKCVRISEGGGDDVDGMEEVQPLTKRRMMTCTYNLRALQR